MKKMEEIKLLLDKYNKMLLSTKEMCRVIDKSTSSVYKMFHEKGEESILKNKLLPEWKVVGKRRKWKLEKIADWLS